MFDIFDLDFSRETSEQLKIIIMILMIVLLLIEHLYNRYRIKKDLHHEIGRHFKIFFAIALTALTVFSVGNYYRFNLRVAVDDIESYDLFHYYLNSKYFKNLSYDRLYRCALQADEKYKKIFKRIKTVRDLKSYAIKSRSDITKPGKHCRKLFPKKEWQNFKNDVYSLGIHLGRHEAAIMFIDRGYNAAPAGNFFLSLLSRKVSVDNIRIITKIDTLLVILAFIGIAWAYGWKISLYTLIAFTSMWSTRWPLVGQALLRYDWIAALIIGICLTKKNYHLIGGAFLAYAALVRIFPLAFVAGLGLKYLSEVNWSKARDDLRELFIPRYMRFAAGFAATVLIITAATILMHPPSQYGAFIDNISEHVKTENLSFQRMGFEIAIQYKGETERGDLLSKANTLRKQAIDSYREYNPYVAIALFLLILLFIKRLQDEETLMLGFIVFFVLTSASYYYYVAMTAAFLLHLQHRENPLHIAALEILLGVGIFAYTANNISKFRYLATGGASVILVFYCILVLFIYLIPLLRNKFASGIASKEEAAK